MIRNFASDVSVGFIVKAARAKYLLLTLFWLFIFVGVFALTIYQLVILGTQLNRSDKITQLKLQRQFPMKFPAVTVCNLNPYKMSSIQSLPQFTALVNVATTVAKRQKRSSVTSEANNSSPTNNKEHIRKKRSCEVCGACEQKYFYKIRNVYSQRILSINDSLTAMNDPTWDMPIVQNDDMEFDSQQWYFLPTNSTNTSFYIYNKESKNVLTYLQYSSYRLILYVKPCNLKNQSFNVVPTNSCDSYVITPSDMPSYYLSNIDSATSNTYTAMENNAVLLDSKKQWLFEKTVTTPADVANPVCTITENPTSCRLTPDTSYYYKIISVRNQKLLGINGSSKSVGSWVFQNDDKKDPSQEWAFQLVDPINNTYRIINRNSQLAMTWTDAGATPYTTNDGSLFQSNVSNTSKYQIFRLVQSSSGKCLISMDALNLTSYITDSAYCRVVKDVPAEGYPLMDNDCQSFMLQKTDSISVVSRNYTCITGTTPDLTKFYKLLNVYSGKVASWNYDITLNNYEMPFVQSDDVGNISQHWYLVPADINNRTFSIYNRGSKKVLTYLQDPNNNYIYERRCNLLNQSFIFESAAFNIQSCYIISATSSLHMAINDCSLMTNANLLMIPYNSTNVMCYKWILVDTGDNIQDDFQKSICNITVNPNSCLLHPDPKKFYRIIFLRNQKQLDIINSSLTNGSNAQQNEENDQPSQEWAFQLANAMTNSYRIYNRNSQMLLTSGPHNLTQSSVDIATNSTFQLFRIVENWKGSCNISTESQHMVITPSDFCRSVVNVISIVWPPLPYEYPYPDCQNIILEETAGVPDNFPFAFVDSSTTTMMESTGKVQTTRVPENEIDIVTNILNGLISMNNTDPVSQNVILLQALPYLTTSMTKEERSQFSYQLVDMLSHCTFNNQNCDVNKDLVQWNDITVGNCFTFNHKDAINQHFTTQAGPAMGLKLLFKVNQNDYLPTTQSSGIRVFVHDQAQAVFPETEGYTVSGSFTAEFAMNYEEVKRTDGDCIATTDASTYYYDGNYSNEEIKLVSRYANRGCIRTCYQKIILNSCGCGDPRFAISDELPQLQRYCGIEESYCIQDIANVSVDPKCFCLLPCFEKLYPTTMTLATVNLKNFIARLITLQIKLPPDYSESDRQQSVLLNIYYKTFEFVIYEEVASYTALQFLSDMGGIVGNNLGFSFLTIFEFFFLLAMLYRI